jgi:hypothetical protein
MTWVLSIIFDLELYDWRWIDGSAFYRVNLGCKRVCLSPCLSRLSHDAVLGVFSTRTLSLALSLADGNGLNPQSDKHSFWLLYALVVE